MLKVLPRDTLAGSPVLRILFSRVLLKYALAVDLDDSEFILH